MDTKTLQPDAPFHSGVSGKYKLLITAVEFKYGNYEYGLSDADGKEYKAFSKRHYATGQLLRCMISFKVENARFVVSDISICAKQDLASLIPEPEKPKRPRLSTIPPKTDDKNVVSKPHPAVFYDSPAATEKTGIYPLIVQARYSWYGDGQTKYQYVLQDNKEKTYYTVSSQTYAPGTEVLCKVEVLKEFRGNVYFVAITGDDSSKAVAYVDNILTLRHHYLHAPGPKRRVTKPQRAKKAPPAPKYKASSGGYSKGERYTFTATGEKDALGGQILRGELGGLHLLQKSSVQYEYGDKVRCTVKGFSSYEHDSLKGQYALLSEARKITVESITVRYSASSKTPSQWAREVQGLGKHKCGKAFKCSCCGQQFPMNAGYRVDLKDIYFCNACAREIYEPGKRGNSHFFISTPMGNKR